MSIILKQEAERLQGLLKEDPDNATLRQELAKIEKAIAEYKPTAPTGGVCISCEG